MQTLYQLSYAPVKKGLCSIKPFFLIFVNTFFSRRPLIVSTGKKTAAWGGGILDAHVCLEEKKIVLG